MTRNFIQKFIYSLIFISISATTLFSQEQKEPLFKFGVIADIQYCDCETSGSRFYRNSLKKLDECIKDLNDKKVDFVVNLGDLVDRDSNMNLDSVLIRQKKLNSKIYNTTGNHDYGGIKNNQDLYSMLDMPDTYYSFEKDGWRFIMLNTNEVASYSNVKNTRLEKELTEIKGTIISENRTNGASHNGGISKAQMEWLNRELEKSMQEEKKVIILSHHPLAGANGLTALNDKEILNLIAKYPSIIKCVISGHHHPGAFDIQHNIPFITTEGMIETEFQNAYGIVEVFADKIVLNGYGRTRSYSIEL